MRRAFCAATWSAVCVGLVVPKRCIALTSPLLQRGVDGGGGAATRGRASRVYPRSPSFDEGYRTRGGQGGRRGGDVGGYKNDRNGGRAGGEGRHTQRGRGTAPGLRRQGDAARRRREDYLMQNAQELLEMKRQYKHAKDAKTRQAIRRNACLLIRRTRIDPSSQDEKSITVLLNCTATFRCYLTEGVLQAVEWMRTNLAGLNPQSVALFANALGVIRSRDAPVIMGSEVMPVVQALQKELAPVEVVMILQACTRLSLKGCDTVQTQLLQQLHPCIADMPIPQLSTLFSTLSRHPMRVTDPTGWLTVVQELTLRALNEDAVKTMHSKEAITFMSSAPYLPVPDDVVCRLLRRLRDSCHFHTTEDVANILEALSHLKQHESPTGEKESQQAQTREPHVTAALTPQLAAAITELQSALLTRLERVAQFATVREAARIWRFAHGSGLTLSTEVHRALLKSVEFLVRHRRVTFNVYTYVTHTAAKYTNLPSLDAFRVISDNCVGIRPLRDDGDATATAALVAAEAPAEARVFPFSHYLHYLTAIRLNLEDIFAAHKATPPVSLTTVLPEQLATHAPEASPFVLLCTAEYIVCADPACSLRNAAHDAVMLGVVETKLKTDPEAFVSQLKPATLQRFLNRTLNCPRAEVLRALLPRDAVATPVATTIHAEEEEANDDGAEAEDEEEDDAAMQLPDRARH